MQLVGQLVIDYLRDSPSCIKINIILIRHTLTPFFARFIILSSHAAPAWDSLYYNF